MRDGRTIGGRLADPACASSYPAEEQLMIGEVWEVDQEQGTFERAKRGSFGMLVDKVDCAAIEFIRWRNASSEDTQDGGSS